jgi:hypothetical protein
MYNPEGKNEEARKLKNNLRRTRIRVQTNTSLQANRIGKAVPRTITTCHQVSGAIRGYMRYVVHCMKKGYPVNNQIISD